MGRQRRQFGEPRGDGRLKAARRLLFASSSLVAFAASLSSSHAQSFQGIGFLGSPGVVRTSGASGVSADGSIVAGGGQTGVTGQAARWTAATGLVGLGNGPGGSSTGAAGISGDGSVIVGTLGDVEAMRWTASTGFAGLGFLGGGGDRNFRTSAAYGTSFDGSVIVGYSTTGVPVGVNGEAFRWTAATGMVGLGFLPGNNGSRALATNANGSVVVGDSSVIAPASPDGQQAFRWTQSTGMVGLGVLAGNNTSTALGVTADGSTVVGTSFLVAGNTAISGQSFRWTQSTGMVGLGVLRGDNASTAFAVSADGAVIIGNSELFVGRHRRSSGGAATIWDQVFGMQDLRQVLIAQYGLNVAGWELTTPISVSADGRTMRVSASIQTALMQGFVISGIFVNRLVNGTYVVAPRSAMRSESSAVPAPSRSARADRCRWPATISPAIRSISRTASSPAPSPAPAT